jgi:50S ribosomal protein L16 3-hydroxylase
MKTFGLAELLHPLSIDVFMSKYWQKQPYVHHGSLERFRGIAAIPALRSIEAILKVWRGTAEAWAPRDTKNPVMTAEADQLSDFFDSGYTLYLSHVEEQIPELKPLARRLELDLGLRDDEVFFEAFVSKGAGSAVHFDPNVTINIQLIGAKQWRIAENKHLKHPHAGWNVGTDVDEEMKAYARLPFPSRMPRGSRKFEARQGTLVYLHPGYWHSTVNHEPSLSLLYTVNPPSWADLLVEEIKAQLNAVEDARELAFGLGSTSGREERAAHQASARSPERCRPDESQRAAGEVGFITDGFLPEKALAQVSHQGDRESRREEGCLDHEERPEDTTNRAPLWRGVSAAVHLPKATLLWP